MNIYQKKMLETYAGGDYAFLLDPERRKSIGFAPETDEEIVEMVDEYLEEQGGDTLALYLFRELGVDGDTDKDEYIARMERSITDIEYLIFQLRGVEVPA